MANIKRIALAPCMRQLAQRSRKGEGHKRRLRRNANMIEDFEKYIGKKIYSNSFTAQMMDEYVYFLKTRPKNYLPSTIRAFGQMVGSSIRKAAKDGYRVDFGFSEIELPDEESPSVYLNETEIEKIFNLKNYPKRHTQRGSGLLSRAVLVCGTAM